MTLAITIEGRRDSDSVFSLGHMYHKDKIAVGKITLSQFPLGLGERRATIIGSDVKAELVLGIDVGFSPPDWRKQTSSDIKDC
jgi:hypothetical protein